MEIDSAVSPREEGELEDGEICDDETDEKLLTLDNMRPKIHHMTRSNRKSKGPIQTLPPIIGSPPQDFRVVMPFSHVPHLHGPFPPSHRPQIGPSGPDRLSPGHECERIPRSSFWERSHDTLGRLRNRGKSINEVRPNWVRGARGDGGPRENGRPPGNRYAFGDSHLIRKESPQRKQKVFGRSQTRKQGHNATKVENGLDESFEDLLIKYKQIQHELECIRNEEKKALKTEVIVDPQPTEAPSSITAIPRVRVEGKAELKEVSKDITSQKQPLNIEHTAEPEKEEKKSFQAFNLKPLRQKLLTPAERDALNAKTAKDADKKDEESGTAEQPQVGKDDTVAEEEDDEEDDLDSDRTLSSSLLSSEDSLLKKKGKDEEEEVSELQLRLLALQSASRKWHQKEQQVMKESQEKITKAKPPQADKGSGAQEQHSKMATRSSTERLVRVSPAVTSKPQEKGKTAADKGKAVPRGHPPAKKAPCPAGSAAKQAWRKQQLRAWKLQKQRELGEQQRRRQEEEEERKRREEEIRKIRDLSNQDEQYNRFMKLVGSKHHPRIKSIDNEHKKSVSKQCMDTSGSLYQYDNYDEVAMDTDSEPESPAPPHVLDPFSPEVVTSPPRISGFPSRLPQDQCYLDQFGLGGPLVPPPLPPLPPPDEQEQPPKPPFADEEEEEEMLLRKELLKALATKRAVKPEEGASGNSGPPSPKAKPNIKQQVSAVMSMPPRSNLTAVNLNSVISQSHHISSKFARVNQAGRAPLVLPRHKAVVVQLNDSDDSESDCEASSSAGAGRGFFGGLESMIKEARRSAEASKPKGSKSEKENNPIQMILDAKRMDQLKKEDLPREKQRVSRLEALKGASSPGGSDSEPEGVTKAASLQIAEAEDKLDKHRSQLEKDEGLLKQLLQQEVKKKEFLRSAETKVIKLREQLLASEKIVSANRVLLKKLQEQTVRVQHRIILKRQQTSKLERDLAEVHVSARGGALKRKNASPHYSPVKMLRKDGAPLTATERHFADLIAHKQRLQQLESVYALKIQKLKEAQALRQQSEQRSTAAVATAASSSSSTPPRRPHPPPTSPFPVSQPSLHDLTQDKLALASEDLEPEEEEQPLQPSFSTALASSPVSSASFLVPHAAGPSAAVAASSPTLRRRSFRDSGSFTKPKLQAPEALCTSTPAKKENPAKPVQRKKAGTKTGSEVSPEPSDLGQGFSVEQLKKQGCENNVGLEDLLRNELRTLGGAVKEKALEGKTIQFDMDSMAMPTSRLELRPVPFGAYHSPLLTFKSYRFSPYFRTKEKLSLSSVTYSNVIEAKKFFCRFDLTGTCNDDDCQWQHMRNCSLVGNQLFQDILSYNLPLIGCMENSSSEEIGAATEKYIKKLFGANRDRMGTDQKAVLLVSKVNESKGHVPPFTTFKEPRKWRPEPQRPPRPEVNSDGEEGAVVEVPVQSQAESHPQASAVALDVCVSPDDKRYFDSETDDISNLETSVLESPKDVQLWIKLAFKYLNQKDVPSAERLDAALNTLSRALEDNRDNAEVWCHYLTLFSRRGTSEELQEMGEMAVQNAPDYDVWWTYMKMETSFEGKDFVCGRMLHYLQHTQGGTSEELHSFRLLESLLYRAQLSLFTGRQQNALDILQNALKTDGEQSLVTHLNAADRALAWLCYIHATEFGRLPCGLYDPTDSTPSRLVTTKLAPFTWSSIQQLRTPAEQLIRLFLDAIKGCSEEGPPHSEAISPPWSLLPLHVNLVALYRHLDRPDEAIKHCEHVLRERPDCCPVLLALVEVRLAQGETVEEVLSLWHKALETRPHNPDLLNQACQFLLQQERASEVIPMVRSFMLSLCEPDQPNLCPLDVLHHLLGFPRESIQHSPKVRASVLDAMHQQRPLFSLIHCTWHRAHKDVPEAIDAYERALGSVNDLEVIQKIWLNYLLFASHKLVGSQPTARDLKHFADLVLRCLASVPTRLTMPFSSTRYWSCFSFHNQVISFYLGCLPQNQHLATLERLWQSMPTNPQLALRLLQQEKRDGSLEHLRFQSRGLCASLPSCLANWRIAIAVERELRGKAEVRRLYQQALHRLPLSATLWKDRLLFEAAEGGKSEMLRKLLERSQELGVSLTESLSLGPSRTATAAGTER